jgi:hypothetical protein
LGEVRLFTLDLHVFKVSGGGTTLLPSAEVLASKNKRLVLEQLLEQRQRAPAAVRHLGDQAGAAPAAPAAGHVAPKHCAASCAQ